MREDQVQRRVDQLRVAADEAAHHVQAVYLTFMLFGFYVAVIVGSTTDEQLLLESNVKLPLLDVGLPIVGFYTVVPWLLVLLHMNLLLQLYLLSRKLHALDTCIEGLPPDDQTEQRGLLFPFPFSHMLVGRQHSRPVRWLLTAIVLVTVVLLPIAVLIWAQVRFLPYHSEGVTWGHRSAVLADLMLLWIFWPMIAARSGRWRDWWEDLWAGVWQYGHHLFILAGSVRGRDWRRRDWWRRWLTGAYTLYRELRRPEGFFRLMLITLAIWFFCFFIAVMPDEWVERRTRGLAGVQRVAEPVKNLFHRNLVLSERTLVREAPPPALIAAYEAAGRPTEAVWRDHAKGLDLRGRDLRFANFRKARFVNVDFRGAKLQNVNFEEAQLQGANFYMANLKYAVLRAAQLQGADLREAQLESLDLQATNLQGTNLDKANLRGANLNFANLQGATLIRASLAGATVSAAKLWGANLAFADLQGAELDLAELQGADLSFAKLVGVNLMYAKLQGVDLVKAQLQAALLEGAGLQGAEMSMAQLQGAQLSKAELTGASLNGASLWKANFRNSDLSLADLRRAGFTVMESKEIERFLEETRNRVFPTHQRNQVLERLRVLLRAGETASSLEGATASETIYEKKRQGPFTGWPDPPHEMRYRPKLTAYLARISCGNEHVATAVGRRLVLDQKFHEGDVSEIVREKLLILAGRPLVNGPELAKGLLATECQGGKRVPTDIRRLLEKIAGEAEKWTR